MRGPLQVLGALVALLLAVGLPRMWRRYWEEVERKRQIQQLREMNALALRKQKQVRLYATCGGARRVPHEAAY